MKRIKNITDFISENIYNNLNIDKAFIDEWVQIYNRQKDIGGTLKVVNDVIQFDSPYINCLTIADPDLLVDGHLPKYEFNILNGAGYVLDIRCDAFTDFRNIPAADSLKIVIDGRVARPKIKDFKQIDNCDYLSIELHGKTNIVTLADIKPFINQLTLLDVPNTPELLSSAKGLTFKRKEIDKNGLVTNYDFAFDAAGSRPLTDFFKNNRFTGAFKIDLFNAYINDFSWMKYMPDRIAKLYLMCPSIDPHDPIYYDFIEACNSVLFSDKKMGMNFDGVGTTHFSAADIQKFIKTMEAQIMISRTKIVTIQNRDKNDNLYNYYL